MESHNCCCCECAESCNYCCFTRNSNGSDIGLVTFIGIRLLVPKVECIRDLIVMEAFTENNAESSQSQMEEGADILHSPDPMIPIPGRRRSNSGDKRKDYQRVQSFVSDQTEISISMQTAEDIFRRDSRIRSIHSFDNVIDVGIDPMEMRPMEVSADEEVSSTTKWV